MTAQGADQGAPVQAQCQKGIAQHPGGEHAGAIDQNSDRLAAGLAHGRVEGCGRGRLAYLQGQVAEAGIHSLDRLSPQGLTRAVFNNDHIVVIRADTLVAAGQREQGARCLAAHVVDDHHHGEHGRC